MAARIDGLGLPLSTSSEEAAGRYSDGVAQLLSGEGGALQFFEAALALDDRCALSHAGAAVALEELGRGPQAAEHKAKARALLDDDGGVTDRERAHVELLTALSAGTDPSLVDRARAHLSAFPTDGLVLDALQRHLFFQGGATRKRALLDLFAAVAPAWKGHWYVEGKRALHLEEVGELAAATDAAERSYAGRPRNSSASHALVHIAHARGAHKDGAVRLARWLEGIDETAPMHGHLFWHVALVALADGDKATARAHWEARVRPERSSGSRALALADAVGLLWSWTLVDAKTAPPWDEAVALARALTKSPGKPFVDVHAAVAFLAVEDKAALAGLLDGLRASTLPLAPVSLAIVGAIAQVLDDPRAAHARLAALDVAAMGGSDVERALLLEVALFAARRAGEAPAVTTSSPHPLLGRRHDAH